MGVALVSPARPGRRNRTARARLVAVLLAAAVLVVVPALDGDDPAPRPAPATVRPWRSPDPRAPSRPSPATTAPLRRDWTRPEVALGLVAADAPLAPFDGPPPAAVPDPIDAGRGAPSNDDAGGAAPTEAEGAPVAGAASTAAGDGSADGERRSTAAAGSSNPSRRVAVAPTVTSVPAARPPWAAAPASSGPATGGPAVGATPVGAAPDGMASGGTAPGGTAPGGTAPGGTAGSTPATGSPSPSPSPPSSAGDGTGDTGIGTADRTAAVGDDEQAPATHLAFRRGELWLVAASGRLDVVDVAPAAGQVASVEQPAPAEVVVRFADGATSERITLRLRSDGSLEVGASPEGADPVLVAVLQASTHPAPAPSVPASPEPDEA